MVMEKLTVIIVFLTVSAAGLIFGDRNVTLEVDSVFSAQEQLKDSDLGTKYGWTNQVELDAHLIVSPAMSFGSDNFQPDVLLDVFITRATGTNAFVTALREAYVDLLFYNELSINAGFIRLDYGSANSWYNPLNVVELLNLESVYQQIMIGNARQGYEGIPTVQVRYSAPELIADLKLSLEQDMISTSLTNLQNNFFLSKFEGIYGNIDLAAMMGYNGDSWNLNDTNRFMPVYGGSLSIRLPYDFMFFGELVYRSQSYKQVVTNGGGRTGDFFDTTAKLSYSFKEPWLNNAIAASLEYFHYGEGMTSGQYGDSYNSLTNSGLMNAYAPGFYRLDRDFQDYIYFTLTYSLIVPKISLSYMLDAELESGYLQHTLSIAKNYDTVTLTASFIYNQVSDVKYSPVFYDQDFAVYLEALIAF